MPEMGRLGDLSDVKVDAHGCPACPHPAKGPAIMGSPDVLVNGLPALRVTDKGIHAAGSLNILPKLPLGRGGDHFQYAQDI